MPFSTASDSIFCLTMVCMLDSMRSSILLKATTRGVSSRLGEKRMRLPGSPWPMSAAAWATPAMERPICREVRETSPKARRMLTP